MHHAISGNQTGLELKRETYIYTLGAFGEEVITKFLVGCFRVVQLATAHVRFDSCHAFVQ